MNAKIFETLEFAKVLRQVNQYSQTDLGQALINNLQASTDKDQLDTWQAEVQEAVTILGRQQQLPISNLTDITASLKRLDVGAAINGPELVEILKLLQSTSQVKSFIDQQAQDQQVYPKLSFWVDQLIDLTDIQRLISNTVEDNGQIKSSASSKLASIRRQQVQVEDQVRQRLNDMVKNQADRLSDTLVTIRNNRYVLPVKSEYRNQFQGTIHDQSASGQTTYIEPQAVISLNNRRSDLQVQERQEIERILQDISQELMPYTGDLALNQDLMAQLDLIQSKAKYARATQATQAKFSPDRHVMLWQARHPLIDPDEIVANDIELGSDYRALIITGPNTGGKTILLKTLGLIQLMGQCGLFVPCESGSQLGIFDNIFADIGDEQSIEQSLSTFSSHMTHIVKILDEATYESLILFDELGSGTDPQEGAALAMAILTYIHRLGATVMATTHYPELKLYANQAPSTINASMEFDNETLSPTYRLQIGVPGRSNALEISERLGLRADILELARQEVSQESQAINDLLANLEVERQETQRLQEEAERNLSESEDLLSDLQTEYQRYMNHKENLMEKARSEANDRVAEITGQAEAIMQEIRDLQLEQGNQQTVKENVLIDKRTALSDLKVPEEVRSNKVLRREKAKKEFQPGDDVEVLSYGQRGTIVDKSGDDYTVQMGILKMKASADDLAPLDKVETKPRRRVRTQAKGTKQVGTSLDLRGKRYEEAMREVRDYLDSALLSNHPQVTIIHGKGTGALRDGVQKLLRQHPQVDRFEFAPSNVGGDGATVAYFK